MFVLEVKGQYTINVHNIIMVNMIMIVSVVCHDVIFSLVCHDVIFSLVCHHVIFSVVCHHVIF